MRWKTSRLAVIVLLLATVGGCAGRVVRPPVVTLESVRLAGLGLRGGTLMVNVEIQNPNRFSLSASEVRYALAIARSEVPSDTTWMVFASGAHTEDFSVGGGETALVQIPVEFSYAGLGSATTALLRAGTFSYRATGAVDVRTPIGSYEVPFEQGGVVSLLSTR